MIKQYTIPIEGIPEGWKAVGYRLPLKDEYYLSDINRISRSHGDNCLPWLILQKTKPREITLVEIDEYKTVDNSGYVLIDGKSIDYLTIGQSLTPPHKIWRIKDEQ